MKMKSGVRKGCLWLLVVIPALVVAYFFLLPTNVFDIKPRYLESVPKDAFTGEFLGYDRAAGRLFSVGADFVDSGTMMDPDREVESINLFGTPGISALWPKPQTGDDLLIDLKAFFALE